MKALDLFLVDVEQPKFTLPETNITPENGGVQWESPFPVVYFQWLC